MEKQIEQTVFIYQVETFEAIKIHRLCEGLYYDIDTNSVIYMSEKVIFSGEMEEYKRRYRKVSKTNDKTIPSDECIFSDFIDIHRHIDSIINATPNMGVIYSKPFYTIVNYNSNLKTNILITKESIYSDMGSIIADFDKLLNLIPPASKVYDSALGNSLKNIDKDKVSDIVSKINKAKDDGKMFTMIESPIPIALELALIKQGYILMPDNYGSMRTLITKNIRISWDNPQFKKQLKNKNKIQ